MAFRKPEGHIFGRYYKQKNATGYHTDAKCCHAFVKRWDYERNDFSLLHGRLEQPE